MCGVCQSNCRQTRHLSALTSDNCLRLILICAEPRIIRLHQHPRSLALAAGAASGHTRAQLELVAVTGLPICTLQFISPVLLPATVSLPLNTKPPTGRTVYHHHHHQQQQICSGLISQEFDLGGIRFN